MRLCVSVSLSVITPVEGCSEAGLWVCAVSGAVDTWGQVPFTLDAPVHTPQQSVKFFHHILAPTGFYLKTKTTPPPTLPHVFQLSKP